MRLGNGNGAWRGSAARGTAARGGEPPRAMTSHPTATGPRHGARNGTGPRGASEGGMVQRAGVLRAKFAGVMAVGRDVPIAPHG